MKALLMKRGDIMREYNVTDYLMRRLEKGVLRRVMVPGYSRRLYRRSDVERLILGKEAGR